MPILPEPPGGAGADVIDLITLAEAHAAINLADSVTTHDVEIARFVTAISQRVDTLCGPVVIRTVTAELHETDGPRVFLRQPPVVAVTEVKEASGAVVTTLTAETFGVADGDYLLDRGTGSIRRRASNTDRAFTTGHRVQVTYTAGRYASTATVAPHFKQAAVIMFARWWTHDQGLGSATFGGDGAGGEMSVFEPRRAGTDVLPRFNAMPKAALDLLHAELLAGGIA